MATADLDYIGSGHRPQRDSRTAPFLWACSGAALPADEPVRTRYMPRDAGQPCKVIAVCLPFVYVERPKGSVVIFDTRQQQLVRLDPDRGYSVWKQMRKTMNKKQK